MGTEQERIRARPIFRRSRSRPVSCTELSGAKPKKEWLIRAFAEWALTTLRWRSCSLVSALHLAGDCATGYNLCGL